MLLPPASKSTPNFLHLTAMGSRTACKRIFDARPLLCELSHTHTHSSISSCTQTFLFFFSCVPHFSVAPICFLGTSKYYAACTAGLPISNHNQITDLEVIFRLIDPPRHVCAASALWASALLRLDRDLDLEPVLSLSPNRPLYPSPISISIPNPMPNPHLFFRPRTAAHMHARRLDPGELWPGSREEPGPQAILPHIHCKPASLPACLAIHLALEFHP